MIESEPILSQVVNNGDIYLPSLAEIAEKTEEIRRNRVGGNEEINASKVKFETSPDDVEKAARKKSRFVGTQRG